METSTIVIIILVLIILSMSMPVREPDEEIIWFHNPNCGHCLNMAPAWSQFESMVGSDIKVRKVNTLDDPKLAEYFGVQGVPHIVKTKGDKQSIYHGDRTAKDLYNFTMLKKQKMP